MSVVVGRVGGLAGADGGLRVTLYDDHNIEEPLFVRMDGLEVPLFVERIERRGKGAQIWFSDVDTPARAELLVGCELFRSGSLRVDVGDLAGRTAVLGEHRGIITQMPTGEANPLFVVEIEGREVLIPAAFVLSTGPREVVFDVVEGLLELNL